MGEGLFYLVVLIWLTQGRATPLDDYVNRPDPTYGYKILKKVQEATHTMYALNMTSQTWKPDLQSRPVWWHYLLIIIPDKVTRDSALMLIDGGSNRDRLPNDTDVFVKVVSEMAVSTESVVACLKQVPNQPITFKDDPAQMQRKEDSLAGWTWRAFIDSNGSDPEILIRMPMTKAAVRGMDTIQDVALKQANVRVNKFFVFGASKRGWTTWTTAAVDKRVIGGAPVVMDLLGLVKNLHHYYRSLGGWTFAFKDYYAVNFTRDLDHPATQMLGDIVDPISFKERYKDKPLLIISAGGDEFFMIDDSKYYYDQLIGPTYLRMVPNDHHSLEKHLTTVVLDIVAFYLSVVSGTALPKMSWNMEHTSSGGRITLQTDREPLTVSVYYATTLDGIRKDFRLLVGNPKNPHKPVIHPVLWLSKPAISKGNNTFVAECDNPDVGWTAFFIEVTFKGVGDNVLEFTTQTLITPDTYPFPDCHGHSCQGVLV